MLWKQSAERFPKLAMVTGRSFFFFLGPTFLAAALGRSCLRMWSGVGGRWA